ncbi:lipoprotein N-acyltransferase Lnb domain-containing protein [Dysgonomonas reticulitermitis]
MRKGFIFLLFIISFVQLNAQRYSYSQIVLSDSAQISLLTNTPWDGAVYALFGHTAIRINDPENNIDMVFNYGIFNMSKENFIFLFVKGETDHMVAVIDFHYYVEEYEERGVGVIEQVYNLTRKEKQEIFDALVINSLPENRVCRYNYFYDNCSTRPRDIIEKYINGKIEYTPTNKRQTYRDLVHECVDIQPWTKFGIDLVIGADADKIITDRQKDFLPHYLMNAYVGAIIKSDSTERRLLLESRSILQGISPAYIEFNEPLYMGIALLVFTIALSLLVYIKKWYTLGKTYDTLLFLVAGAGGCIIFFLMFFSEHPCTNPNWNIIWLNPLQLLVALLFFVKPLTKCLSYYHFINFVALLLFLLAWCLIPQQLEIAFIPYILSICLRSGMNVLQQKTKKKADYSLPKAAR